MLCLTVTKEEGPEAQQGPGCGGDSGAETSSSWEREPGTRPGQELLLEGTSKSPETDSPGVFVNGRERPGVGGLQRASANRQEVSLGTRLGPMTQGLTWLVQA